MDRGIKPVRHATIVSTIVNDWTEHIKNKNLMDRRCQIHTHTHTCALLSASKDVRVSRINLSSPVWETWIRPRCVCVWYLSCEGCRVEMLPSKKYKSSSHSQTHRTYTHYTDTLTDWHTRILITELSCRHVSVRGATALYEHIYSPIRQKRQ